MRDLTRIRWRTTVVLQLAVLVVAMPFVPGVRAGDEEITIERDVAVPMRDGTVLRANVFRPSTGGPYPVLVWRTPYGKSAKPNESLVLLPRSSYSSRASSTKAASDCD